MIDVATYDCPLFVPPWVPFVRDRLRGSSVEEYYTCAPD